MFLPFQNNHICLDSSLRWVKIFKLFGIKGKIQINMECCDLHVPKHGERVITTIGEVYQSKNNYLPLPAVLLIQDYPHSFCIVHKAFGFRYACKGVFF